MIEAALEFVRRGFRVLPVRPNSKIPCSKNWPQRATSDPDALRKWWLEAEAVHGTPLNIGFAMGEDMIALDIDKKGDKDGFESLKKVVPEGQQIPRSWSTNTAGGGLHRFLRKPRDLRIKNSNSSLAPGVDIKAEGGFVVAPGSIIDGKAYTWKPDYSPDDIPIADAPQYLLDLLKTKRAKSHEVVLPSVELDHEKSIGWARRWLRDDAPEAVEGSAGREITKQVIQHIFDVGLSPAAAYELLTEDGGWDELKAKPSWLATEGEALENMCYGLWEVREKPAGYLSPLNCGFEAVEIPESEMKNFNSDRLTAVAENRFTFRTFDQLADAALSEPSNFLVDGVLKRGELSATYGAPGTGKSFFALELAYCIASGQPFAEREVRQGVAVYMVLEGANGAKSRAAALRLIKPECKDLPLIFCDDQFNLYTSGADARGLCESLEIQSARFGAPLRLIIIDTLAHAIAGGDESSAKDMGALIANARSIARETGAHVKLLHHTGKDASKEERGSTSLRGAVDTMIKLTTLGKTSQKGGSSKRGVVEIVKQKDGEEGIFAGFKLRWQRVGVSVDLKPIDSCTIEWISVDEAQASTKVLSRVQAGRWDAFNTAEQKFGVSEWVSLDAIHEASEEARRLEGEKPGNEEKIKARRDDLRNALNRLTKDGHLVKNGQNWRRLVKQ